MRRLVLITVLLLFAAGCSSDETQTTVRDVQEPTSEQSLELERLVDSVYPGVPEGKATDWSISVCERIEAGAEGDELIDVVTQYYRGGSRPDPSPSQAAAIADQIRSWCYAPPN